MNIQIIKEILKELKEDYKKSGKGPIAMKALKDVSREILQSIKDAKDQAAQQALNQEQEREEIRAYTELLQETLGNLPKADLRLLRSKERDSLEVIRKEMSKLGSVLAKRQFSMLE